MSALTECSPSSTNHFWHPKQGPGPSHSITFIDPTNNRPPIIEDPQNSYSPSSSISKLPPIETATGANLGSMVIPEASLSISPHAIGSAGSLQLNHGPPSFQLPR